MKFEEAFARMKAGEAIRRPDWEDGRYLIRHGVDIVWLPEFDVQEQVNSQNMLADDWEAVPLPEKFQVSTKTKKFFVVRVTTMKEDFMSLYYNKEEALIELSGWCQNRWEDYFNDEYHEWEMNRKPNLTNEALINMFFKASKEMDASPSLVTIVEGTLPEHHVRPKKGTPTKLKGVRALDLSLGDDDG